MSNNTQATLLQKSTYVYHMCIIWLVSYENHKKGIRWESYEANQMIHIWSVSIDSRMIVYTYDSHMIHIWSSYEKQCICALYVVKLPLYITRSRVAVGAGMKKIPHSSIAVSAEYRTKFASVHRQVVASPSEREILERDI